MPPRRDEAETERLHRHLISRTWELSLDLLEEQGLPEARALMRLLSCFAPALLPVQLLDLDVLRSNGLLSDPSPVERADRALEALVELGLLDVSDAIVERGAAEPSPCLVVHRLVSEANAAHVLSAPARERRAVWRTAAAVLETATAPAPESRHNGLWWRLVAPHVLAATSRVPADDPEILARVVATALRAFAYLWFAGSGSDGVELSVLMFERTETLDPEHPVRLSVRHRYALTRLAGEQEVDEYQSVVEAQRRVLGPDDPETLTTRHNWVVAARRLGRLTDAEAEAELRAILDARRRVLGERNPYTLFTLNALSQVMAERGHPDLAAAQYQEIVECSTDDEVFEDTVLEAHHQLAHLLHDQRRYAEAERNYRTVVTRLEEVGDTESSLYADMRRCLARVLRDQKRYEEAEAEYRTSIEHARRTLGADASRTLDLRHELADMLDRADRHDRAEEEYLAVLEVRGRILPEDDSVVLQDRHCLAHALNNQGRHAEAERQLREVLSAYQRILGADADDTVSVLSCLSHCLDKQGRMAEAEKGYRTVLEVQTRRRGAEHPETLLTRYFLARALHQQGRYEQAEAEYRATLDAEIRVRGREDPSTLITRHRLALVLQDQRRLDEAEREYRATLEARRRVLGEDHEETREVAADLERLLNGRR